MIRIKQSRRCWSRGLREQRASASGKGYILGIAEETGSVSSLEQFESGNHKFIPIVSNTVVSM